MTDITMLDSELEALAAPPPLFRFVCPAGCHLGNEAQCRRILRTAIDDAIRLASHAAARLEARPRTRPTIRLFTQVFGHSPNRTVPWGGGRDSGGIVARRYRLAIRALRGRGTRYECASIADAAVAAGPARVLLGPSFWHEGRQHRAAIVLHEMMHQYFLRIRHDPREHRRNNAYCLEVFALRASGIAAPASDVTNCLARPT
jgi:hypothetical protein